MGLFDWLTQRLRTKRAQPRRVPNMVVLGGGNRRSAYEVGEIPRTVADGMKITPEIIRYLRYLAIADEDVYGAVRDLVVLANPGYRFEIEGRSRREEKKAKQVLESIGELFESGSLEGFINNQIFEVVSSGASSVEWVPNRGRRGVRRAYIVPAETIVIERLQSGDLRYFQRVLGEKVYLNTNTFKYIPLQTVGASPYGVPLIIAALPALRRKGYMIESIDRLLEILGLAGIVHAKVSIPSPQEAGFDSELDPSYIDLVSTKLKKVAELLTEGEEQGVLVTPEGTELNVTSPARDISGAYPAWIDNEHRVWSGTRTLPFMRGRSESLSETWAKVALPIILTEAQNIQKAVRRQVEFGINLHLRLLGIAAKASLKFDEPQSPFTESNARARNTEVQTDVLLIEKLFPGDPTMVKKLREKYGLPIDEVNGNGVPNKAVGKGEGDG